MQTQISDPRLLLLQTDHSLYYDSIPKKQTAGCCTREKVKRVVWIGVGTAGFIGTSVLLAMELLNGHPNHKILAITTCFNGVATTVLLHPLLPEKLRKLIYRISSDISYPLLYTATQLYLNLVPQKMMAIADAGFTWWLGAYAGKDLSHALSLKVGDFSPSTEPPKEEEELKTLCCSPRNKKVTWIVVSTLGAVAIASNVVYLLMKPKLTSGALSDLENQGMIQDIIAIFNGAILGHALSHVLDSWKETKESRHAQRLLATELSCCSSYNACSLISLRITKNVFMVFTPPVISGLLAVPLGVNSLGRYVLKFGIASLYGAHQNLSRREFSNLHKTVQAPFEELQAGQSSVTAKILTLSKKYWTTLMLLGGLIGYMSWVATTSNSGSIHGAIATMLVSSFVGSTSTIMTQQRFRMQPDARFTNEMAFQLLYATTGYFFYQYLTTTINIYGDDLPQYSWSLYGTSLLAWCALGLALGNIFATFGQKKLNPLAATTHPLTMQELSKSMSLTLSSSK